METLRTGESMEKRLSGENLKWIALAALLIDSIALAVDGLPDVVTFLLHGIGILSLPIACFCLIEGYQHTRKLYAYFSRLLMCAVVTQAPFHMLAENRIHWRLNPIFGLCASLLALVIWNRLRLPRWQKMLLTVLIGLVSLALDAMPLYPVMITLVFWYCRNSARERIRGMLIITFMMYFLMASIGSISLFVPGGILPNISFGYSSYLFFAPIALLLLPLYDGTASHHKGQLRSFLYLFVPLIYVGVTCLLVPGRFDGFELIRSVMVAGMIFSVIIGVSAVMATPTRVQNSILLLMFFLLIYTGSFTIELSGGDLEVFLLAVKIEYFGQLGLVLAFTYFMAEFLGLRIKAPVYFAEGIIGTICMALVLTVEQHHFFYQSYEAIPQGAYFKLKVTPGPGYVAYYTYLLLLFAAALIYIGYEIRRHSGLERKRMIFFLFVCLFPCIATVLDLIDVFGTYDVVAFGIFAALYCLYFAITYYGYLDSVQVAVENVLRQGSEGVLVIDNNHNVRFFNEKIARLYPELEHVENAYEIEDFRKAFEREEKTIIHQTRQYDLRVDPLLENKLVHGHILWMLDMTEHYALLEKTREMAETDALTHLSNRASFIQNVNTYLSSGGPGAMLMMDVDNFKSVNDVYGHDAGDAVLGIVAESMRDVTEDCDYLCRIGGDEFAIFLVGDRNREELSRVAENLLKAFERNLHAGTFLVLTTLSVGITRRDTSDQDFSSLYHRADEALYAAKRAGKNTYQFYKHLGE